MSLFWPLLDQECHCSGPGPLSRNTSSPPLKSAKVVQKVSESDVLGPPARCQKVTFLDHPREYTGQGSINPREYTGQGSTLGRVAQMVYPG